MTQFKYKFEKYDYKRYLLDTDPARFKADKFIFWVGKIPLPDDIIFRLFDGRGDTLSVYIDHVVSMLCLTLVPKNEGGGVGALSVYPNSSNPSGIKRESIESVYKNYLKQFKSIEEKISSILILDGYQCNAEKIQQCLAHSGKKYKRIFIPDAIREIVSTEFENIDYKSFQTQSDMFGNVIADYYGIYRSGFSDALSSLFNKMIDFLISGYQHNRGEPILASSKLKLKVTGDFGTNLLVNSKQKDIRDGSVWEPAFIDNSVGYYVDGSALELIESVGSINGLICQILSELELQAFSEKERKRLEYLRKDISRSIKSKVDDYTMTELRGIDGKCSN